MIIQRDWNRFHTLKTRRSAFGLSEQARRVACWGYNSYGDVGDGTTTSSSRAVGVIGVTGAVAVSAGWEGTCATKGDETVACWGFNSNGQLSNGRHDG